jgi:hypothetical protein
MKNSVIRDVTPYDSCKNRSVLRLLLTANVVPTSPILIAMMMEAIRSSEAPVLTEATQQHIPEDFLHSHHLENLKSYRALTGWALYLICNVFPVRYELGFYIPADGILHSHRLENLKSYLALTGWVLNPRRNVFPVRYDWDFISQQTAFSIATAAKTSHLTLLVLYLFLSNMSNFIFSRGALLHSTSCS